MTFVLGTKILGDKLRRTARERLSASLSTAVTQRTARNVEEGCGPVIPNETFHEQIAIMQQLCFIFMWQSILVPKLLMILKLGKIKSIFAKCCPGCL